MTTHPIAPETPRSHHRLHGLSPIEVPLPMPRKAVKRHTHQQIWDAVLRIPEGFVTTYGEVARACRLPGQARLVGYALHNLPPGTVIPWHRVINARGMISLPGTGGQAQRNLLAAEGITLLGDRVDVEKHGWKFPRRRTRLPQHR